ncbi:GNAT family N-acetyltransferase [Acetobacterium tundrae]|uniref:GNAT family N-acetyltransferase n=1 Tax=Acetobacterium tundrae TaxID=132932 RepID=A0ABR6WP92_9FIRM|nr:GNAT family N-acetyltransferase [Acetobacterium tundrae]MBC3798146.1 GNAT family N-acetyltransferase [Acetobacterium tundrae]
MEFSIAADSDIEQLIQMRMLYIFEDFKKVTSDQKQAIEQQLPEYFKKHIGKDMIAFIAKEQNKIVATALLLKIEKPANPRSITGIIGEVLSVYTCTKYRRQGIAKLLMEMLLSYSKEQKIDFIELKATEDGYSLYKDLGFVDEKISYALMKYII